MAFQVEGWVGDVAYRVTVDVNDSERGESVIGSPRVQDVLTAAEGDTVGVTPTGPFVVVDLADETAVLAALMSLTQVMSVSGDAPEVIPPAIPDVVY